MTLRQKLVDLALEWQQKFGVAPAITSTLSELDAAVLVGMTEDDYAKSCAERTSVSKGHDFVFNDIRYQVKANRPSGKPGSFVTLVVKAKNYDWDKLIWILYDTQYVIQEARLFDREDYIRRFHEKNRLSPKDMREGTSLAVSVG